MTSSRCPKASSFVVLSFIPDGLMALCHQPSFLVLFFVWSLTSYVWLGCLVLPIESVSLCLIVHWLWLPLLSMASESDSSASLSLLPLYCFPASWLSLSLHFVACAQPTLYSFLMYAVGPFSLAHLSSWLFLPIPCIRLTLSSYPMYFADSFSLSHVSS
jgi:hypothetical protein